MPSADQIPINSRASRSSIHSNEKTINWLMTSSRHPEAATLANVRRDYLQSKFPANQQLVESVKYLSQAA
jgi:hypothetical protein